MRHRFARHLFEPQLIRQVEPRQGGHVEQAVDKVVLVTGRDVEFVSLPQERHPGEGAEIAEAGNLLGRHDQAAGNQQDRAGQRQDFILAAQLPLDVPVPFRFVGDDAERKFPRRAVVPFEGRGPFFPRVQKPHAPGRTHQRHDQLAQFVRDAEAVDGGLNLGLLGVPVGPLGRAAGEVGEDAGVVGPHQLVNAARAGAAA